LHSPEELCEWVAATPARHVVLTGGEPTLHDLGPLIQALKQRGFFVQIETSGAFPLGSVTPDWITFSPKRFHPPHPMYYTQAQEIKVVIHARSDLAWAEAQRAQCASSVPAFLQPEAYQPASLTWILEYIKANPHWRLSMQWHRYLAIP
jgi:organic radical activating enzyme